MNKKITSLSIEVTEKSSFGRPIYKTIKPFIYENSKFPAIILKITVPVGFETDFASVPRIFWFLFPPGGQYTKAAVIHDYLYRTPRTLSRPVCDGLFLEIMKELRVPWYKRLTIYSFVRLFGWMFFNA